VGVMEGMEMDRLGGLDTCLVDCKEVLGTHGRAVRVVRCGDDARGRGGGGVGVRWREYMLVGDDEHTVDDLRATVMVLGLAFADEFVSASSSPLKKDRNGNAAEEGTADTSTLSSFAADPAGATALADIIPR